MAPPMIGHGRAVYSQLRLNVQHAARHDECAKVIGRGWTSSAWI